MTESAPVSLREATFDDCLAVSDLLRKLGLSIPPEPDAAKAVWTHIFRDNPAMSMRSPTPAFGWLLETEDRRVVGFFGNIPLRYQLGDRALLVGDASQWGVEKPFRSHTNELAKAYFAQQGSDLLMVTSAIRPTWRIFERFGSSIMPLSDYDRVLYWVLDGAGFLRSALVKKKMRNEVVGAGSFALGPLLGAGVRLLRLRPGMHRMGLDPEPIELSAVGDEFDDLWHRKVAEKKMMYASRRAEDLRWHFARADKKRKVSIIRCRRAGRLAGYATLLHEHVEAIDLKRTKLTDMLVEDNDPTVIDALLATAYDISCLRGSYVLELVGFPKTIREHVLRYRPFSRLMPTSPFHYKACSAELASELKPADVWYPTLFDGDSCF